MPERQILPYGSWPSPITMDLVVAGSRSLGSTWFDGDDLYFLEGRPDEGGRVVLMRRSADGQVSDVTPPDLNVRTRAHEYGGGAYTVQDGLVVSSNFADSRLYVQSSTGATATGAPAEPLTGQDGLQFADMVIDAHRNRVVAVMEDLRDPSHEARSSMVAVSLVDGSITELMSGHDFFSDPRLDLRGDRLTCLTWEHPDMPWDATRLWVAPFEPDGSLGHPTLVAGGPGESIVQPTWAPDGSLVFASDRTGWWNLYRWREGQVQLEALAPLEAEFAGPQWVFGLSTFAIDRDGTIAAVGHRDGRDRLFILEPGREVRKVPTDATALASVRIRDGVCALVAGSPTQPTAVVRLDPRTGAIDSVRDSGSPPLDEAYLSVPRFVEFPTTAGQTCFAYYYPPTNPLVRAPDGELPPLVVVSHAGPTSATSTSLSLGLQAFTSRGFAVVDVDYGGSTGYGRPYRERLRGQWGVVDVDDCTSAAVWLADQGLADGRRLAIRGGSAGGFTTLASLCFRDVFAAGASYYGVGDLEALAQFTHKFESRYVDGMVAPLPEGMDLYRERSPIHHVDGIRCPVLVLQGDEDLIVPRAQADEIVAALERNGVPHAYLLFEGEGHGFRRAENQRRAREAELSFYAQVFGFELADSFAPIEVAGLEDWRRR